MRYILSIDTDNAAFDDTPELEVVRILRELVYKIEQRGDIGPLGNGDAITLYDGNGNPVGTAGLISD